MSQATPRRISPLSWDALAPSAPADPDRIHGPTNAQATLRLFGQEASAVRVTLYRDHHAWCPYCQKIWLWLEEKRIPYRIRKVTMFCYGEKEAWFRRLVPSGMLPALELDGKLLTESDRILASLEAAFGCLHRGLEDPAVRPLRQLERLLFQAWCQWLCQPVRSLHQDQRHQAVFAEVARRVEGALEEREGPYFLEALSCVDTIFVPYLERMNASLAYYKGYDLRRQHPAIHRWFEALERRPTYLGTQSDFHTHAHDLPPQMGGCFANGTPEQRSLAARIDLALTPWEPLEGESSQPMPAGAAAVALGRVLQHRTTLLQRNPLGAEEFDPALRSALTLLITGEECPPSPPSRSHQRAARHASAFRQAAAAGPGAHRLPGSRRSGRHRDSPAAATPAGPGSPPIPYRLSPAPAGA
jgi:glutathione S-transferase